MAEIKRCKMPFAIEQNGMTRVVGAGELVSTDDPAYSDATADNFEDIEVYVEEQADRRAKAGGKAGKVEQATAEPGEKRAVGRPRKGPAAK